MLDYFATSGPIWLKGAGCPGRTTAPTGGGSSWFWASPLGGAACCGARQPLLLVADAASGGVSRLCGGRRGPTAFTGGRQAMQCEQGGRSTSAPLGSRRASSRRTHKSGREAPRDYSSRFRRAGLQLKGPRRGGPGPTPTSPRSVTEPPTPPPRGRRHPRNNEKQECAAKVIWRARALGVGGVPAVRLHTLFAA